MRPFLLGLLTVACLSTAAQAQENWPRFRGPNADGVAPDNTGLPTTWTTTDNVKWVADVPGWGWSCPVVWGDRVFVTSVVSDQQNLTPSKGLYLGEGVRDPAKGIAAMSPWTTSRAFGAMSKPTAVPPGRMDRSALTRLPEPAPASRTR